MLVRFTDSGKNNSSKIINKYKNVLPELIDKVFDKLPLTKTDKNRLKRISGDIFSKYPKEFSQENYSGLVIAGFGENETFPSFKKYQIEVVMNGRLKFKEKGLTQIDFIKPSAISAFAQKEMVATFMEGIDPDLSSFVTTYIQNLLRDYPVALVQNIPGLSPQVQSNLNSQLSGISNNIFQEFTKAFVNYRKANHIAPILEIVNILSKNDLAEMAESLVHLTSLKRKFTPQSETVGGPIDVAVISKGDGFVWIKRKHYFNKELNPGFFMRYNN